MVLRSMPVPAWLNEDAPDFDIAISSRTRYARNLRRFRFPHHASNDELRSIQRLVRDAARKEELSLEPHKRISEAERDYLIGCRLISPEFLHREPGRMIMLDDPRSISVMINEEDHIRLQALTAGWSIRTASSLAGYVLEHLESSLEFAKAEDWGFFTSSPFNCGRGRRLSAMFHLIGLAHTKRLPSVLKALVSKGLSARGLFGESSRAVGAFFQVSSTEGPTSAFEGACDYLIRREREARFGVARTTIRERTDSACDFVLRASEISLADSLRIFGWMRWAASIGLSGCPAAVRDVDAWVSMLEVKGTTNEKSADRLRATFLRECLGL